MTNALRLKARAACGCGACKADYASDYLCPKGEDIAQMLREMVRVCAQDACRHCREDKPLEFCHPCDCTSLPKRWMHQIERTETRDVWDYCKAAGIHENFTPKVATPATA